MASSTSSHSSSNSEPGTSSKTGRPSSVRISTVCPRSARTAPEPSSTNSVVVTENNRAPPSSCAEEVRRMSGHRGHGLSASRSLGGSAMISSWCTDAAPWRCAVPRQSAPVSPPPMMTTCLPLASMGGGTSAPSWTRLEGLRYSRARCTPSSSRPGTGRSRGSVAPPASTTASKAACTSAAGRTVTSGAQAVPMPRSSPGSHAARRNRRAAAVGDPPTDVEHTKVTPSASIWASRRSSTAFSILNSGMP